MPAVAIAAPRRRVRAQPLLTLLAALVLALSCAGAARAQDKVLRVGYQKYGTLVLLKGKGFLESRLKPLGYTVQWSEFPSGPPLIEALNAGAIDLGTAGEAPPIFGQAASRELVYVAAEPPAPRGEAILVPKDSPIRSLEDLRGKTIAFNKGSNVHYLLVKALEKGGVPYDAFKPAYLAPADAAAAFSRGAVDAWAIWDPFLASAERSLGARTLTDAQGLAPNRQFYLSRRGFAEGRGPVIAAFVAAIAEVDAWAKANADTAAADLAPAVGIPAPILSVASSGATP